MVNALPPYNQILFLLGATVTIQVIIRSAAMVLKLCLVTSTGTATNVLKFCDNPAQSTSLSFMFPPTPFHLNSYKLNLGINSQSYNRTPMESVRNYLNYATCLLPRTLLLLPSKSLNSEKQTKLQTTRCLM